MIVTMNDMRELKYCAKGVKKFFENQDLDFKSFLKNGIDTDILESTKDAMALRVVNHVKAKNGRL